VLTVEHVAGHSGHGHLGWLALTSTTLAKPAGDFKPSQVCGTWQLHSIAAFFPSGTVCVRVVARATPPRADTDCRRRVVCELVYAPLRASCTRSCHLRTSGRCPNRALDARATNQPQCVVFGRRQHADQTSPAQWSTSLRGPLRKLVQSSTVLIEAVQSRVRSILPLSFSGRMEAYEHRQR